MLVVHACQYCKTEWTRPPTRGSRPKWCSQRCADLGKKGNRGTCACCYQDFVGLGSRFCSQACDRAHRTASAKTPPKPKTEAEMQALWRSQRSPLRAAIEDGLHELVITEIKARSTITRSGCWEWNGATSTGSKRGSKYPTLKSKAKTYQVHRVALEAKHGKPLGSQQAHHTCANTLCVNPDHLQPATFAENIAEMKARRSYISRIAELEAALFKLDPGHELLNRIEVRTTQGGSPKSTSQPPFPALA